MRMAARPVQMPQKARSKYRSTPTMVDGIRFASKAESLEYARLRLRLKAGQIRALALQPRFPLSVARESAVDLQLEPPAIIGHYVADFSYEELISGPGRGYPYWQAVVADVKSAPTKTALYRWKAKHMMAQYNIQIREVR